MENTAIIPSQEHNICEHELYLQEGKQFWCDCPFVQELHFGFDERFYSEEAKPWYHCEICQKCHCGTSVKIKRA